MHDLRLVTLPGVFRPISDSRFLADVLREQTLPPRATALDLCTGSGILALTAAAARRRARSPRSTSAAARSRPSKLNALMNRLHVRALRGDLYAPVAGQRFDAIVSNPPYVPSEDDELPTSGPERAWDAGRDGRLVLDRIIAGRRRAPAPRRLHPAHPLVAARDRAHDRRPRRPPACEAECVARRRGPLGPLMSARVQALEAEGLLEPGQRHEDVVIIRGRKPAPKSSWTSGAAASEAAAPAA